jgi:hypothetical protein
MMMIVILSSFSLLSVLAVGSQKGLIIGSRIGVPWEACDNRIATKILFTSAEIKAAI